MAIDKGEWTITFGEGGPRAPYSPIFLQSSDITRTQMLVNGYFGSLVEKLDYAQDLCDRLNAGVRKDG